MTERRHIDPITGEVVDNPEIALFAEFLQGRPKTHEELSEALWDLVARVVDTGKKGSVTLTVIVERDKKAQDVLFVSDEIKLRLPEYDRPAAIYWQGRQGNLSRSDPRQPELEGLRALPDPTITEAKELKDHA